MPWRAGSILWRTGRVCARRGCIYSLGYYPSSWDRFPLALSGLLVIILALVALGLLLVRRDMLAARTQSLAGGLCMALVWALACGNALLYAQSQTGGPAFFLAPIDVRAGLLSGIGLGALAALAIGAFVMFRSAAIVGMMAGAALGLVIFRLIFGPTAGFGGEVGYGVGQEVGVMFGAVGGLLGGILGGIVAVVRMATRLPEGQPQPQARVGRRLLVALLALVVGGLAAGLIGAIGVNAGVFQFLVPYNAQIPDVPPDTSPAGMLHDFLFGLGLFVVGGALIGCFLALQWMSSAFPAGRRHSVWLSVGLVVAFIGGLTFGLDHRFVGGPPLIGAPQIALDPAASVRWLLVGLAVGMVSGAGLLVFAHATRSRGRWQATARTTLALVVGVLALTLPYWYTPIFAISIM